MLIINACMLLLHKYLSSEYEGQVCQSLTEFGEPRDDDEERDGVVSLHLGPSPGGHVDAMALMLLLRLDTVGHRDGVAVT